MDKDQMIPGKRYLISLSDCCIRGDLIGTFLRWNEEGGEKDEAVFDIGTIGPMWGQWEIEEDDEDGSGGENRGNETEGFGEAV